MTKKKIIISLIVSVILATIILIIMVASAINKNKENTSISGSMDSSEYLESNSVSDSEESEETTIKSEDIPKINDDSDYSTETSETTSSSESYEYDPNNVNAMTPDDSSIQENNYETISSDEQLNSQLNVAIDSVNWDNIKLSDDQFYQWLIYTVPKYGTDSGYTYVVNFDKNSYIITVSVIDESSEALDFANTKLKTVIQNGINHSNYIQDNVSINIEQ